MALPKLESTQHELTVPSTGKKFLFRPFTVKEQKILMLANNEDKKETVLSAKLLIKACTFDKLNIDELTTFDFEYIFLKIRTKSVGETSDVIMKCTECSKENEVTLDLETAEIENIENAKDKKIRLSENVGIILKHPSIDEIAELSSGDKDFTKMIISMIDTIYDTESVYDPKDSTPEELTEFVDSFSASQVKMINEFFQEMPAVKIEGGFKCLGCGHDNKYNIKGLQNFF